MDNNYQTNVKHMPLPYFEVDEKLNVLARSDKSVELFNQINNFLDIVDLESREKAVKFLSKPYGKEIELVLTTAHSPYSLFSCSICWNEGIGYLLCVEQTEKIKELEDRIEKQCNRLAETNYELLTQKEHLEQSLKRILELSANFIKLSESVGLVPLTGELHPDLFEENHITLTNIAHEGRISVMFFDFCSVDKLSEDGINAFSQLIHSLSLIGVTCYVIGLKAEHAFYLKNKNLNQNTYFMRNLDEIIQIDHEYYPPKNSILLN
ncbi:hypothetical protein [Fictibacillus barbaricus]|uniref:RsbT co-antagonist protein RsbR n=1 Tax=Fictibacillus barbaricus TaxID=182136 RepID=A0ABU1TYY4_9BACL|nr:hypothetical protein [Fictibacillus barbaricus]MDR7072419.1 rsbT co-antagonist protein RsbR [Fictibacillus barbaricus]